MVHSQCKARQRLHRVQQQEQQQEQQQQQQQHTAPSPQPSSPADALEGKPSPAIPPQTHPDGPHMALLAEERTPGAAAGAGDADGVLLMLEALRLLALKLCAVSNSKLLLLQEERLQQVGGAARRVGGKGGSAVMGRAW